MTLLIVAEFRTAEAINRAACSAAKEGFPPHDALTPFPVPELQPHLTPRPKRPIGWVMVGAGALAAGLLWFLQWYSAAIDYPIISGNRPFNAWQIFFLVSFEACILFSGIAGFVAFARDCRFPSLYHPLFQIAAIERASQDRFFLVFETPEDGRDRTFEIVRGLNPTSLNEVAL
jgi:hypothetical protein